MEVFFGSLVLTASKQIRYESLPVIPHVILAVLWALNVEVSHVEKGHLIRFTLHQILNTQLVGIATIEYREMNT